MTKDFEIIFDTNESDNRFILQRRFDAISIIIKLKLNEFKCVSSL